MKNTDSQQKTAAFIESLRGHGEWESLLDHIPGMSFFLKDRERRLVYGNAALIKLLREKSFDPIYGKTVYDYFPKSIADAFDADDRLVMEHSTPVIDRIELLINEAGKLVWHCTTKLPLYGKDGSIVGLKAITRHIHEADEGLYPFVSLRPVIEYIHEHLHEAIEIETLTAISGLSESHFRRKFKEVFLLSPVRFILKLRILNACNLLQSSTLTISEISDRCGFENQNYFARYFRQQMGKSPREYRKKG